MNKNIKTKWVKALRSGNYKQGKNSLAKVNKLGNVKYCCLGVLCDLYLKEHKQKWNPVNEDNDLSIGRKKETAVLPLNVRKWAGLDSNPILQSNNETLASMNDDGFTFKKLADAIENEF